jgi:hypothetical protein
MIEYFDNFVTGTLKKDLQDVVFASNNFLWQYRQYTSSSQYAPNFSFYDDEHTKDSMQLVHVVDSSSTEDMSLISPLLYKISDLVGYKLKIIRTKFNMLLPEANSPIDTYHRPHVDHGDIQAKTLIYYVNDCDGDTIIFDKTYTGEDPKKLEIAKRITPKAGSAVLFDSNIYHASSAPTQGPRSVINFIFLPVRDDGTGGDPNIPPLPTNFPGKGFNKL